MGGARCREKGGQYARFPTAGAFTDVADGVHDSGQGPAGAQSGGGHGEVEARDEEGAERRGVVFDEVVVGSLGCVILTERSVDQSARGSRLAPRSCTGNRGMVREQDEMWRTAVELEGSLILVGVLRRGVGVGVLDAAALAVLGDDDGVDGVHKEGRGGGGEDQAAERRRACVLAGSGVRTATKGPAGQGLRLRTYPYWSGSWRMKGIVDGREDGGAGARD